MSKRERQTSSAAAEQKTGPAATSIEGAGGEQPQSASSIVPDDGPDQAQRSQTAGVLPEDATVKHPAYEAAQDHARVLALVWRARLELVGHPAGDALRRLEETTAASAWACPLRQIAAALRLMHKDTAAGMLVDAADLLAE